MSDFVLNDPTLLIFSLLLNSWKHSFGFQDISQFLNHHIVLHFYLKF